MTNSLSITFKLTLLIIIFIVSTGCSSVGDSTGSKVSLSGNYPRWLRNDNYYTNQTSGITFLSKSDDGSMQFLLADDIGKIHRFIIKEDTLFSFSEINFNSDVEEYLEKFPKKDFEEIFFDKFSGYVYITIEGNEENHLSYHGIYRLKFKDEDIYQDSIIGIEKLVLEPVEMFNEHLRPNIGYEGFTTDEKYFYFGLENLQTTEGKFSENTVIRVADKKSFKIIKEVSTAEIGITTICGLYSNENYSLWGIDRNQKKVFKLNFDEYFNVEEIFFFEVKTIIPGYNNFEYVGSLESITLVSEHSLFLVDDPWHTFFIPPDEILNQLDSSTSNNFKNFIPVIYKFDIE